MGISIFKQSKGLKEEIDIQEAFNIWNALRARYHSVETIQLLKNFIHDKDFTVVLGGFLDQWTKSAEKYEELIEQFKIKSPTKPPRDFAITVKINHIADDLVYRRIYNDLTSQMYFLATAYRSSVTNDHVRKIIRADLESHLKNFDTLYKYGKLKGWMDDPPAYKTAKAVVNEPLAVSEAFHILDHIGMRYHQLQLTKYFLNFAHDKDFRLILSQGKKSLEKQIKMLEEKALKYEVPLPNQPPASVAVAMDPETMEDRFMYMAIYTGIQNAVDLHVRAVIETIRNDSLRTFSYDLFTNEMGMYENYLKYGKAKGWISSTPIYAEPV